MRIQVVDQTPQRFTRMHPDHVSGQIGRALLYHLGEHLVQAVRQEG